ncbi:ABC transporter substrate-binding protein [Streptomyces agglomeratus]|uniref:ABC transporter substrate-binding protein n=1 Tax=Streptomyces agglomeratus TaxID=285458 RepID=A0A1E5P5R1_9ACTN|nr:ABC transporter substrate-binding protein [Streptomyces agglomeratus]OEJ53623.1 ABC transporter substrate-binding protein [Streptomyces agglomeratus]OEJ60941.1 ABC transporter substrate-binding protein [Streptomyces agglomeratus]
MAAIAVISSASLLLAGCSKAEDKNGGDAKSAGANAATKKMVNASDKKGGTVTYAMADAPESFDPGNTYYAFIYNFSRLYARPLMTFKPAPGEAGNELVPDLAASKGVPTDGGKTWTYKIREGVKYDDGTVVTSKDVKYAVERSNFARDVLSLGPNYFQQMLADPDKYKGPYKDKGDKGLASIQTPDDTTIVFKLKKAFADFDYLVSAPQTAPVPKAKDKGVDYTKSILSSGSYKFETYQEGKQVTLVRNPNWDAKTDPLRKQYPDKIVLNLKVNQATIDKDLLSGATHVDLAGRGVDTQTQAQLMSDPKKKANTDNTAGGRLVYTAINTKVAPFNNVECRKAVQYAVDKVSVQTAMGGSIRGDIASTVMPTDIKGYVKDDMYATPGGKGDAAKAKEHLKACGQEKGFKTVISARSDRQSEVDSATAIVEALKKVGIEASIKQYPSSKYFSDYAGVPKFTKKEGIGLMMMQWGSDWPTGYGFLQQIAHGEAIGQSGNTNLSELNDPAINKLLDDAIANTDEAARNAAYTEVDKKLMEQAVIVPLSYFKVLLYRSPNATNLVSTAAFSGQYDYLNIGTTK